MASFYLSPFVGTGVEGDEFRPDIEAGSYSIIDLRSDPTSGSGWCLVGANDVVSTGSSVMELGDSNSLGADLPSPIRNQLKTRLAIDIQQTTLSAIVAELLLVWGEEGPGRTRWRPLKANRSGRHKILLGGETIYDAPVIEGAVITDDFNRASGSTSDEGWSWSFLVIDTNRAYSTGNTTYRAEIDLDSDDIYAQSFQEFPSLGQQGVAVRIDPADNTTYYFSHHRDNLFNRIYKKISNTATQLATTATGVFDGSVPTLCRLEVDGSNLTLFVAGSEVLTATDTEITGFKRTGITSDLGSAQDHFWDNFEAGDLYPINQIGSVLALDTLNGSNRTFTFDVPPAEGDLVLLIGGTSGSSIAGPLTSGYTTHVEEVISGQLKVGVWYKFMGPTPDTSVVARGDGVTQHGSAYYTIVLRGVDPTTPFDAPAVVLSPQSGTTFDPEPITTVSDLAWVFALAAHYGVSSYTGYPSGYTLLGNIEAIETERIYTSLVRLVKEIAGVEDPGTFTMGGSVGGMTFTFALRPASTGIPFPGPPSNLAANVVSPTQIDLSWDAVNDAIGYRIYKNDSVIVEEQAGLTYSDTSVTPGSTNTYEVRPIKGGA